MKIDFDKRLPILPVPSGSGNSLLLDFNIRNIHQALNNFKKNQFKYADIIYVESINEGFKWYCINILGLGFISNIAKYGTEKFNKCGSFKYILSTFFVLKEFKKYDVKIAFNKNKEFLSNSVYFISLSNSKYTGGRIMIAPEAKFDDGLIDVVILYNINRFQYLVGFLKTFSGKHINEKGCMYFKAKEIEIRSS